MKDFIMPILALIGGILSLFVDSKDKTKQGVFLAALAITAAVTIYINIADSNEKAADVKNAKVQADETRKILLNLTEVTRPIPNIEQMLMSFGYSAARASNATPGDIQRSVSANAAYTKFVAANQIRTRTDAPIRVQYFPKNVDGNLVTQSLKAAGFTVELKKPFRDEPTNSVWVGDDVSDEEAKTAAMTIIRAGVGLVSLTRFVDGSGTKARLIQIGADARKLRLMPLSVEAILSLKSLPRDTE